MVYTYLSGDPIIKHNRITIKQGETIFSEGEKGDAMYVIVAGKVQIVRTALEAPVVLATLRPGTFFGEMAILQQTTRTATAVAVTDTVLTVVKGADLEVLLKQRPDIGAKMIYTLTQRLRDTTNKVMDEREKAALLYSDYSEFQADPSSRPAGPVGAIKDAVQRLWADTRRA